MGRLENYLAEQSSHLLDGDSMRRSEVAYMRIKDALQHAGLEPGEPLSEPQLSKMLGISRTPVREALQQLAQEGLVQVIPGRAVTVASRSVQDVLDVIHMRSLLEPELARLAAESASEKQRKTFSDTMNDMETALRDDDYNAWSKADVIFHDTMSKACPNPLLGETVVMLRNRVHHLAKTDSRHNPARLAACTAEHRRIVDALLARSGKGAEEAMRDHLNILRESMFNKLMYGQ
ncbi:MAG: FCD domain-containing protein [Anaerolineaceae bacterium]|nr:FCD domain-containing protein [Anaerolineaceae bacterium]